MIYNLQMLSVIRQGASLDLSGRVLAPCGLALRDALAYYILPVGHSERVGSVARGRRL